MRGTDATLTLDTEASVTAITVKLRQAIFNIEQANVANHDDRPSRHATWIGSLDGSFFDRRDCYMESCDGAFNHNPRPQKCIGSPTP